MRIAATILAIGMATVICDAQSATPAPRPTDFTPAPLLGPGGSGEAAAPIQPVVYPPPPPMDGAFQYPTSQPTNLYGDGLFVVRKMGKLSQAADGKSWTFSIDPNPLDPPEVLPPPPLTVMPNRQLASMLRNLGDARFAVTGHITVYNRQNYILIEQASSLVETDARLASADASGSIPPAPISATMPSDQVLNQMLRPTTMSASRMLRASTSQPSIDSSSGRGAIAPDASQFTTVREGTFIVDRVGRLTQSADGQSWEFNFEADGRTMRDPPVVVLPNLKLASMQAAQRSTNKDLLFRVTGMLTEYNGRNYVLLDKVVVVPETARPF